MDGFSMAQEASKDAEVFGSASNRTRAARREI